MIDVRPSQSCIKNFVDIDNILSTIIFQLFPCYIRKYNLRRFIWLIIDIYSQLFCVKREKYILINDRINFCELYWHFVVIGLVFRQTYKIGWKIAFVFTGFERLLKILTLISMSLSDGYGTNVYFPCPILAWQFLGLLKLNLRLFFFFEKIFEVFTNIRRIQGFIFF
jgi:hypothetical protein